MCVCVFVFESFWPAVSISCTHSSRFRVQPGLALAHSALTVHLYTYVCPPSFPPPPPPPPPTTHSLTLSTPHSHRTPPDLQMPTLSPPLQTTRMTAMIPRVSPLVWNQTHFTPALSYHLAHSQPQPSSPRSKPPLGRRGRRK